MERCGRHPECDPKVFPDAVQIAELNYLDTIELAYSGAQIIHPKTIKPLQNKNIPLYVRPFGDKRKTGHGDSPYVAPIEVPILILKKASGIADDSVRGTFPSCSKRNSRRSSPCWSDTVSRSIW